MRFYGPEPAELKTYYFSGSAGSASAYYEDCDATFSTYGDYTGSVTITRYEVGSGTTRVAGTFNFRAYALAPALLSTVTDGEFAL